MAVEKTASASSSLDSTGKSEMIGDIPLKSMPQSHASLSADSRVTPPPGTAAQTMSQLSVHDRSDIDPSTIQRIKDMEERRKLEQDNM